MTWQLRFVHSADLTQIVAMERQHPAGNWTLGQFEQELQGNAEGFWVSAQGPNIAGYICFRPMGEHLDVLNLRVDNRAQRCGIGRALLALAMTQGQLHGCLQVVLEVRASNGKAQAFYRSQQLVQIGRRRQYYTAPLEDAVVYGRELPVGK